MFQPDTLIQDTQEDFLISDGVTESSQTNLQIHQDHKYEIVPASEIASASLDLSVDIRPRIYDGVAKSWTLVDTGSQVSVLKPGPEDRIQPHLRLEVMRFTF